MSRRLKTIVVLGFELCLVAMFCASLIYFVLQSRDFLAPGGIAALERPGGSR